MTSATDSAPHEVLGNDWSTLVPEPDHLWTPTEMVSICIPTRDPGVGLTKTLQALAAQTYPHDLIEVVVADDGSERAPVIPEHLPFPVRVVRLEQTLAFGAGRARNAAARESSGSILMFLDADVVPERQVVHVYARWFEHRRDPLVMGLCRFVDVDDLSPDELVRHVAEGSMAARFEGSDVDDQLWRETTFERTRDLTLERFDAFRVTIGATLAISRAQFDEIGGFAELGVRGVEDTEFGYRAHANGAVLVLDRDAAHWHQGRRNLSSGRRDEINRIREPFVQALMPLRGFRRGAPPLNPPVEVVPIIRVRVQQSEDPRLADRTRSSVLATEGGRTGNVVLADGPAAGSFDPSFIQATVPAGVVWTDECANAVRDVLTQSAVGVVRAIDERGDHAIFARTRALRRARRDRPEADPFDAAAGLFGVWWTTIETIGLRWSDADEAPTATPAAALADQPDVSGRLSVRRILGALFARGLLTFRKFQ